MILNQEQGSRGGDDFFLVAIGASAGGLEVFQEFFRHLPEQSGLAFVLIQHLDRNHDSLNPELLSKHTSLPIRRAEDNAPLQANAIHVISPNVCLTLKEGCFKVRELGSDRLTIDQFFRSASQDRGEKVVGIVLSGTGSDGALGLKAIKEGGGLALAQPPASARFDDMPCNVIETGMVDFVLPVAEMPEKILQFIQHAKTPQKRQNKGEADEEGETVAHLEEVFSLLKAKTGHDFRRYKESTLLRRLLRRMQETQCDSALQYLEVLRNSGEEAENLFKDLLIGVTQFFRDAESFATLQTRFIPLWLSKKSAGEELRVWVPGCASGEEAYTLAIILHEEMARHNLTCPVKIFATDLDVEALEQARCGNYSAQIEEQMEPRRLAQFFRRTATGYQVREEIREMCIFCLHNLIKDPPFSRLDLISCRNVLIYLEVDLQKKLLPLFHYALNPSGNLFLGPSENIASRSELFRAVDPKHRVYERKPAVLPSINPVPLLDAGRVTKPQTGASYALPAREQSLSHSIERLLIEEYTHPTAIINDMGEVVYFSGKAEKYLKPPTGSPTNKILSMARKQIRLELRMVVHRALNTRQEVARKNLAIDLNGALQQLNLTVRPIPELGKNAELYIVIFEELLAATGVVAAAEPSLPPAEDSLLRQLENELRTTKEDLQATIEELESSNEEMKSANEELLSMNEELQTSKEEIQSVNDELQRKIEEVDAATSEMVRTLERITDGFMSFDLRWRYTYINRQAREVISRLGRDSSHLVGRNLWEIFPDLIGTETYEKLHRAMEQQAPVTFELFYAPSRMWAQVRAYPSLDGLSVYFQDTTEQKKNQSAIQQSEENFRKIFDHSNDAIFVIDAGSRRIVQTNKMASQLLEYSKEQLEAMSLVDLHPPERQELEAFLQAVLREGSSWTDELHCQTRSEKLLAMEISGSVMEVRGRNSIIALARDISERKQGEKERAALLRREQEARNEAETLNEAARMLGAELDLQLLVQKATDAATRLVGAKFGAFFYNVIYEQGESLVLHALSGAPREAFEKFGLPRNTQVFTPTFRGEGIIRVPDLQLDPRYGYNEPRHGMPKGPLPVRSYLAVPVNSRSGEVMGGIFFGHPEPGIFTERAERLAAGIAAQAAIAIDNARLFSQAQRAAEQIRHQLAISTAINVSLGEGLITVDKDGRITFLNPAGETLLGWNKTELLGKSVHETLHNRQPDGTPYLLADCPFLGLLKTGINFSSEEDYFIRRDGSLFPVACIASPISTDGSISGAVLVFHDITERKKAEEQLKEQAHIDAFTAKMGKSLAEALTLNESLNRCTQTMVDHLQAAFARIWVLNEKEQVLELKSSSGTYTHINGAHARVPLGKFKIGRIASSRKAHLTNHVLGDPCIPEQEWAARERMVSFAGYPLIVDDRLAGVMAFFSRQPLTEKVLQAMGSVADLVAVGIERKRTEEELQRSEDRFRSLVHASSQVVWTTDCCGAMEEDSPSWRSFTGQSLGQALGWGWLNAVHPDDREATRKTWQEAIERKAVIYFEYRLERADGAYRWTSVRAVPMLNADTSIREWIGTNADIHDKKEAEAMLEHTVAERTAILEETIGELEAFSYSVSHDLRTPLRAMEGYAQAVLEDCSERLDTQHKEYLERIIRGASRLDRLTLDVLAYSRLSRTDFQANPIDMTRLISDIIEQYPQFQAIKPYFQVRAPLLPMMGHQAFLTQCVSNLFGNAIKFVAPGTAPSVSVWSEATGSQVRLFVEDNGIGIAPNHRNRIFQIFGRVHSETLYEGTGIGLAIVKRAVEKMGGSVDYISKPGHGTRFWIELPGVLPPAPDPT